jgi:hypothetical protein
VAFDHRIVHVAVREDVGHRMAHQLADAQLTLGLAGVLVEPLSHGRLPYAQKT